MPEITDAIKRKIRANLVEFGYSTVTQEDVDGAVTKVTNGEDVRGDIIAMFTRTMLEEAGLIAEEAEDAG